MVLRFCLDGCTGRGLRRALKTRLSDMPYRLIAIVLALYLAAAAWFTFAPLDLPSAQAVKAADERWQLVPFERVDPDDALSVINEGHLFGTPESASGLLGLPPPPEKPLTPPNWRIAGVYSSGPQYVALMAIEGNPAQQLLHVGDSLPGGAKILRITPDRISVSLNGKKRSIITYQE